MKSKYRQQTGVFAWRALDSVQWALFSAVLFCGTLTVLWWLWIGFVGRSFDRVRGAAVAGLEKEGTLE